MKLNSNVKVNKHLSNALFCRMIVFLNSVLFSLCEHVHCTLIIILFNVMIHLYQSFVGQFKEVVIISLDVHPFSIVYWIRSKGHDIPEN